MENHAQYAGYSADPYAQHQQHDAAAGYGYQAGYPGGYPPQPDPYGAPPGGLEEIRTIYLSGFPAD
eukprot:scaffold112741_cov45-Prasinocladus_malaysianus.AAC.1